MKILAIRGCNIASLAGEFEIDFTCAPLAEAGLFAITGRIGAGKSTILDTLCLALYGTTPRMERAEGSAKITDVKGHTISVGSVDNLIRKNTGSCYAEVDFEAIDGKKYRSRWSLARARNKPDGTLQNSTVWLGMTDGTPISNKKTEVREAIEKNLIGLSFEQFTRSVLLAQGEFSSFLKASDKQRAEILEKLTGTEIYSAISKRIFEKTREAGQELSEVQAKMGQHKLLTEEDVCAINAELKLLEDGRMPLEARQKEVGELLQWFKEDIRFNSQMEKARIDVTAAESEYAMMESVRALLEKIDNVAGIIPSLREEQNISKDIKTDEQNQTRISSAIKDASQAEASWTDKLKDKAGQINLLRSKENELKQQLIEARDLDSKIGEKQPLIMKLSGNVRQQQQQVDDQMALIAKGQQQLSAETQKFNELNKWFDDNRSRESVALNIEVIKTTLGQATSEICNLKQKQSTMTLSQSELLTVRKGIAEMQLLLSQSSAEFEQIGKELGHIKTEFGAIDHKALKEAEDEAVASLDNLQKLMFLAKGINEANSELLIQQRIIDDAGKVISEKGNLERMKGNIESLGERHKQTMLIYQMLARSTSEGAETLRATLEPDKECPVCGSIHHPYATEGSANGFRDKLNEIDQEGRRLSQEISASTQAMANLSARIDNATAQLQSAGLVIERKSNEIGSLSAEWQANPQSQRFADIAMPDVAASISEAISGVNSKKSEIVAKLAAYDGMSRKYQELTTRYGAHENKLTGIKGKMLAEETRQRSIEQSLSLLMADIDDIKKAIDLNKSKISGYFNGNGWIANWENDSQGFLSKVEEFARRWETNQTELIRSQSENIRINSSIQAALSHLDLLKTALQTIQTDLKSETALLGNLSRLRLDIFGGRAANEVEKEYLGSLDSLEKERMSIDGELQKRASELKSLQGQSEAVRSALEQKRERLFLVNAETDALIARYTERHHVGIDRDQIVELMGYPTDRVAEMRLEVKSAGDKLLGMKSALDVVMKSYDQHKQSRKEAEVDSNAASVLASELATMIKDNIARTTILNNQLEINNKTRATLRHLEKELNRAQANLAEWSILNEELGAAQGDKFRKIAQEYTLDFLLLSANVHMAQMAPRYRLRRLEGYMSFEVFDLDMCDESRSINTLSGGETFLVSLALALGLSTFSSDNMDVESLFIDEGFGSLDDESLNSVMDALEALRNQGRKVGVISHVSEMSERIGTHIRVIKGSNGASRIEIS